MILWTVGRAISGGKLDGHIHTQRITVEEAKKDLKK
jgi:hypothetical protein